MKNRIFFKLLAVFLIVIGATAALLDVMLGGAWERSLRGYDSLAKVTYDFVRALRVDRLLSDYRVHH